MIDLEPPFRLAEPRDGAVLAKLVNFAGEGMPLYLWQQLAEPGEDPWVVGARRHLSKLETGLVIVADDGEGAFAELTGYSIGAEPEPLDELPAMLVPLQDLENHALNSWYVNILAIMPDRRNEGWGTKLLAIAETIGRRDNHTRMSVIVADNNGGARRLYERTGYREVTRRPMVKNGWTSDGQNWVLLIKPLA